MPLNGFKKAKYPREMRILPTKMKSSIFVTAMLLLLPFQDASADVTTERLTNVVVENAIIESGKPGNNTRISFRIINFGTDSLTLVSINTKIAESVKIMINMPENGYQPASYLTIQRGETLDTGTSHLVVEVQGLSEKLIPGTEIDFNLEFTDFTVAAIADVHSL